MERSPLGDQAIAIGLPSWIKHNFMLHT